MLAFGPFALAVVVATSTASAASAAVTTTPPAITAPAPRSLAPIVIDGVLFRAVEFDTGKAVWRNLAITVTADHLADWHALTASVKDAYAQRMIDLYRAGTKYDRAIKLTFIDERDATLDQYVWTPPGTNGK